MDETSDMLDSPAGSEIVHKGFETVNEGSETVQDGSDDDVEPLDSETLVQSCVGSETDQQVGSDEDVSPASTYHALDAIKMWENKTAGTADGSATTKKSLSVQKSLPVVSKLDEERSAKESSVEKEEVNGTDDKPVVDDKENKEEAGDSASTTQSHSVSSITRSFKSQSLIERGTRTSPSTGKRGFTPAVIEKCHACNKTVYTVERLKADDKIYHKNCFKCSYCKKVVGTGTYAANKGEIFCKTHFKMLFKIKGNYDEGFGREQHKKKWGGSSAQTEEQAAE